MTKITEPGIYDIPEADYHADPVEGGSLSPSSAKLLVPGEPYFGCPARFDYARKHPPEPKKQFDFGHAAHKMVLGRGQGIEIIAAKNWQTKAAREARDAAHEAGRVPALKDDFDKAQAMADAVFKHPFAGKLFENGVPERTLIWRDAETGVMCRTRPDFMPQASIIYADYKTISTADPDRCRRNCFEYGYPVQAAMRIEALKALKICEQPSYVFVFQEKDPPYLITVMQPDADDLAWGHMMARKAIHEYYRCTRSGDWSEGYADDVVHGALPGWAHGRFERQAELGVYMFKPLDAA